MCSTLLLTTAFNFCAIWKSWTGNKYFSLRVQLVVCSQILIFFGFESSPQSPLHWWDAVYLFMHMCVVLMFFGRALVPEKGHRMLCESLAWCCPAYNPTCIGSLAWCCPAYNPTCIGSLAWCCPAYNPTCIGSLAWCCPAYNPTCIESLQVLTTTYKLNLSRPYICITILTSVANTKNTLS